MNPKTQPDTSALEILKAELGERRMKILEDNNLTLLVQWAMVKYDESNVVKPEPIKSDVRLYFQSYKLHNDWGSYLQHCFNSWEGVSHKKNEKWMKKIVQLVRKNSGTHIPDVLDDTFRHNITLNYEFATKLNRFDNIKVGSFIPINELGKCIIEFVEDADVQFVLVEKGWLGENGEILSLRFIACECSEVYLDEEIDKI